jgi:hypothetical protein
MKILQLKFVEFIPEELAEGILYISMEYRTATHLCVCGCGNKVVTPLSPTDWQLTFDGKTITLNPSIGNWGFECRSHYWIKRNRIEMAPKWTEKKNPTQTDISNEAHKEIKEEKKVIKKKYKEKLGKIASYIRKSTRKSKK